MSEHTLAFSGGGNMARSLIGGLVARGVAPETLRVAEPVAELREALKPSIEQQFRAPNIGTWLNSRRFPSFDDACWKKNKYDSKKCS